MKAAVWHTRKDIRIEDIPEPEPGPGQVKAKIKVCGICGSDLHEYLDGPFTIPSAPHLQTGRKDGSVVLGHEFSAEVTGLGESVTRFEIGDRVTANALIVCGECRYCKRGAYNLCLKLGSKGTSSDGGFAEFTLLEDYSLYKLPDSVTDDMGAFVEPLSVAIHAVKRSRMSVGDSVAVIGAGPIGLLVTQVSLTAGASHVFVIEPAKARREIAKELGASAVFDPDDTDPRDTIKNLTDGLGVDIAFDCAGNQPAFDTAVRITGRGGVICIVSLSLKPIEVPFNKLMGNEKEIIFSIGYEDEFQAALALLADKRADVESLISARIRLEDLVEKGMRPLTEKPDQFIKILVNP